MQLAMIGLGRMGANMVRRLIKGGHQCVVFDMSPKAVEDLARGKSGRRLLAGRPREQAGKAAGGLADGSGGRGGQDHCRPRAASGERRHPHRRRQLVLRRRYPPRQGACGEGDPLRGRRHQRRRVGTGARLLHDDRRPEAAVQHLDPIFKTLAPGTGRHPAARRDARRSAAPPSTATCIAVRTAPAISSRWSTTASSTASWPLMPKG